MSRRQMPGRRRSESISFVHRLEGGNQPLTATVSFFEDGQPAEIFLDPPKVANSLAALARDVGLLISIALQYGAPVSVMRDAVGRSENGDPHSIAGAALDAIASSKS